MEIRTQNGCSGQINDNEPTLKPASLRAGLQVAQRCPMSQNECLNTFGYAPNSVG